jgi:hypothetical protein
VVDIPTWAWLRNAGPTTTEHPAVTSSDGGDDHEFEGARLPKLTLHPLICLGGLMMAFLAGTAGAVMAVWPTTCAWFIAGLVVVVPVVAAASRHLGSTPGPNAGQDIAARIPGC